MRNIVIFGGTGGLGSQLAEQLSAKFNVIALGSGDVNIADFAAVASFFAKTEADIVLNFSGVNSDGFMHKYTVENQQGIDEQVSINIRGTINILSACLPQMRSRGYGRIVLTSSILAEVPVVSTGVYAGCKGFIDSITKTVALENASKGVTCNSLQLGYFDGGLTYKIPEKSREAILNAIPMKRFGTVAELAGLVNMLIDTEYITGTNIKINGGLDF